MRSKILAGTTSLSAPIYVTNSSAGGGLGDISCPTAQFCAATDSLSGDVIVSTGPAGGSISGTATSWRMGKTLSPAIPLESAFFLNGGFALGGFLSRES